jgi:hypothetical protein
MCCGSLGAKPPAESPVWGVAFDGDWSTGVAARRRAGAFGGGGLGIDEWTPTRQVLDRFGDTAAAELIYSVGFYCLVSVTLNGLRRASTGDQRNVYSGTNISAGVSEPW